MSKVFTFVCGGASILALSCVLADASSSDSQTFSEAVEIAPIELSENAAPAAPVHVATPASAPKVADVPFKPFTGKVKGKKVRLRAKADLDSSIVKELVKDEMVAVVGEHGDFWSVEPPAGTKAFVFRSFILDGMVEGNRVNVRLSPDLESPIIGHLSQGDKIQGSISSLNNKWLEITPPAHSRFYVAKDYVENLGGPELKMQFDKRHHSAQHLLETAAVGVKTEMHKPFSEIDIERISHPYTVVIKEYSDFPEFTEQAREQLVALQESYLQKKMGFMELKEAAFQRADSRAEDKLAVNATDRMKLWHPIEEAMYLTWSRVNEDKDLASYYNEQKSKAIAVTGMLEAYTAPVKNKPGDYILRDKDIPVGYVYSTQINLQDYVGKKVTLVAAPRPNNHFAFPAYFVFEIE